MHGGGAQARHFPLHNPLPHTTLCHLQAVGASTAPAAAPAAAATPGAGQAPAPHGKKPKPKEIPVPEIKILESYTREYLPTFRIPETYIRGKGELACKHTSGVIRFCKETSTCLRIPLLYPIHAHTSTYSHVHVRRWHQLGG